MGQGDWTRRTGWGCGVKYLGEGRKLLTRLKSAFTTKRITCVSLFGKEFYALFFCFLWVFLHLIFSHRILLQSRDSNQSSQSQTSVLVEKGRQKNKDWVIKRHLHVLFFFDYFFLIPSWICSVWLRGCRLCVSRGLPSESGFDLHSSFCLNAIVFIMFLMLILCLIPLSLTVFPFSHNANRNNTASTG